MKLSFIYSIINNFITDISVILNAVKNLNCLKLISSTEILHCVQNDNILKVFSRLIKVSAVVCAFCLIAQTTQASSAKTLQIENPQPDSTKQVAKELQFDQLKALDTDTPLIDSPALESEQPDTIVSEEKEADAQADTTIDYKADRIDFDVKRRLTILTGKAQIKYKETTLEAHKIEIDWDRDMMTAVPSYDTVYTDTTETEIDTINVIGIPTFIEKNQTMTGKLIRVNMETKQGYIVNGRTSMDEGFYRGEEIQKVSDKVLYVQDGYFTSCDLEVPHYGFAGNNMKMVHKDKVVGKPIIMKFGDVPVAALPFAVFSVKPGRHSGVIVPAYGDDSNRGRHFTNLGYYFAFSDYWDLKTTMNFYEKRGMLFQGSLKYNQRYKLNGGISGSFDNQNIAAGSGRKTDWDLRVIHNQDIDPTLKIRANGTFLSRGNYYQDYSDNAAQRMNKKMESSALLTKSWTGTSRRLQVNMSHKQDLSNDENSQLLPNASMSFGTKQLFPSKEDRVAKETNVIYRPPEPRRETDEEEEEEIEPWYRTITYNYNTNLKNSRTENRIGAVAGEPRSGYLQEKFVSGIQHSISVNAPQKVAKYFTVNPRLSYKEDWFNERRHYSINGGELKDEQERGFYQRRTFSTGINTSTKLYGYFNINRAGIKVIRHVISPSVNFNYRPDFSIPDDWGYYKELYDDEGNRIRKDYYQGSVYGGTPKNKQLALSMSVTNLFQMKKVKINKDGEEEEIKSDLFTYNLSTNYDLAKDSLQWGNLSSSLRATPVSSKNSISILQQISFDLSAMHSFYQYGEGVGQNGVLKRNIVDKFYWEESGHGFNFLRMTSFSANSNFTFSGQNPFTMEFGRRKIVGGEEKEEITDFEKEGPPPIGNELEDRFEDPAFSRGGRGSSPWRVTGSLRYNLSMNDPQNPRETIRLTGSTSINLTKNWSFSYSSGVDLVTRRLTGSSLSIQRDLHCWQGSFSWSPVGYNQGFFLRIGIKASQLQDVKLEQRRGRGGTVPYFG